MADKPIRDDTPRLEAAIDRYWDAVADGRLASPDRDLDPRLAATIRRVHALAGQPLPDPDRADHLWRNLMSGYAPTAPLPLAPALPRPFNGHGGKARPAPRPVARPRREPGHVSTGLSFLATIALVAVVLAMIFFIYRNAQNVAVPPAQETPTTLATPTAHAWPMWGGNAARTRAMPGRGPEGQPVALWTYPPKGVANPHADADRGALADGALYLPTDTGAVIALDATTGRQLWQAQGYGDAVVVDGDGLIVHGDVPGGAPSLARIRRSDGGLVWTAERGKLQPAWNPVVADGVGYTPSGTGFVAFDPATGQVLWRVPLAATASRGASVADGLAVLGDEQGTVYGISTAGGDVVWTYQTDATTIGHPTLANGVAYFNGIGGAQEAYYAVDAATGAPKWRFVSPSGIAFHTAAIDESTVYLPGDDGTLFALDAATGALRWQFQTGTAQVGTPALVDGTLYFATESGFAFALDPATGAERWRFQLDSGSGHAAIVVDGVYYLSTDASTVYAIGGTGAAEASPTPAPAPTGAAVSATGAPIAFVWAASGDDPHQLANPGTVAIDPAGRVWVSSAPGLFFIFDLDGNLLETWGTPGGGDGQFNFHVEGVGDVGSVTFAADGGFYVADFGNARVAQFDKDRRFVRNLGSRGVADGQFLAPVAVAIDGRGNLLVSDGLRNDVQRFAPNGAFLGKFGGPGDGPGKFRNCGIVTVAPDGSIWVGDISNNRVQVFTPDGAFAYAFGGFGTGNGGLNMPSQAAFDGAGHVFVSDQANNLIQVFDEQGRFLAQFGGAGTGDGQFSTPQSVALYRGKTIFVVDWGNNRLEKFKVTGPFPATAPATPTP
jgi:outer membrane protein assembly factor BamB